MARKLKTRWHIDDMSADELKQFLFRIFACASSQVRYRGMTLAEAWDFSDDDAHIEFLLHSINYGNFKKTKKIVDGRYGEYIGWRSERVRRYKQIIIIKTK